MTVADLKELLSGYPDNLELYFVAEEMVGKRRLLYFLQDHSDFKEKVFLTGRLSRQNLPRETHPRLNIQ
ncbi:MAG: hypothetical protein EH225_00750 [Calditrichaeota bacterium]|nr:MAG: hypothetical protein EH225_00750 [Calditrichota bacterium]